MHFAILASPRTGSTSLCRFLTARPDIHCHGEVFKKSASVPIRGINYASISETDSIRSDLKPLRDADPDEFLRRVYAISFGKPTVGFKIFKHHDPAMVKKIVEDANIKKIVLYRANILACYASQSSAIKAGSFGAKADKPPTKFRKARFRLYKKRTLDYYERLAKAFRDSGQDAMFIRTQDLGNTQVISAMLRFLNSSETQEVLPKDPEVRGSSNILERFTNPKIVRKVLERQNLSGWFVEDENSTFDPILTAVQAI